MPLKLDVKYARDLTTPRIVPTNKMKKHVKKHITLNLVYHIPKENSKQQLSDSTKRTMETLDSAIRNQGTLIKALEIQIGQMSKSIATVEAKVDPIRCIDPYRYAASAKQNSSRIFQQARMTVPFPSRLYNSCWTEEEEYMEFQNLHVDSYGSSIHEDNLPRKEKDPGSFTLPCFINNTCFNKALADLGASVSVIPYSTYMTLGLGDLVSTKLIVELADRTVKRPNGIAKNVLVGIDKFTFPVDFVVLDIPEDIKTPLILGRPFLSHAKIDVFKRKITLKVGNDKVVFQSDKPISNIIRRVYALSLEERIELDLKARLMGETLIINRSQDPNFGAFLELNDLNEPLELRHNQVRDLGPTIEEGEVIDAPIEEIVKARIVDIKITNGIEDYPSSCDHDRKIHANGRYKLSFYNSIMKDKMVYKKKNVVGAFMNVPIFVGPFCVVTDFAVMENMDAYRDEEMGDIIVGREFCEKIGVKTKRFKGMITIYNGNEEVSARDELEGISHPYQKLKKLYNGVLNLGRKYIKDEEVKEWVTRRYDLLGILKKLLVEFEEAGCWSNSL
ncbi:reverse transcriptase domain-containing protein [Tanacetum coccineum]